MKLAKFAWETMKTAGLGLWGATLFWALAFLLSTIAIATTVSAADLDMTFAKCDEVVVVNNSGGDLDVFLYGTLAGTRVPPGEALLVDATAARRKTLHFRIVGYNRDGTLAGTVERVYDLTRPKQDKKPERWIWEIRRGDL